MKYELELKVTPYTIKNFKIVRIPKEQSDKFTSRGQVMVEGLINNQHFVTPLEPDGKFGHWFNLNDIDPKANYSHSPIDLKINQISLWDEPNVPNDIKKALNSDQNVLKLWKTITPMARWEWIRWINSTASADTRSKRIRVALDKMNKGERRPCCWNRNLCSEPAVSRNGVLLAKN